MSDAATMLRELSYPWGPGERTAVPNLALQRGQVTWVASGSLRLQGLSRLAGYRHESRGALGEGTSLRLEWLRSVAEDSLSSIFVIDSFAKLRADEKLEECSWLISQMEGRLLRSLFEAALTGASRILVLAPSSTGQGLGLRFETGDKGANVFPFDERSLEERQVATLELSEVVARALEPDKMTG